MEKKIIIFTWQPPSCPYFLHTTKISQMKVNEVKVHYSKKIVGKVSNSQTAVDYCKSIPEFENRMEYQEVLLLYI